MPGLKAMGNVPNAKLLGRRASSSNRRLSSHIHTLYSLNVKCSAQSASAKEIDETRVPPTSSPTPKQQQSNFQPPPSSWPSEAARLGAFSPTCPEHQKGNPAQVSGRLPEWLNGTYIRNGPGTYSNGTVNSNSGMEHMFDGYACLVKMEIDGASNTVVASHRFLDSQAYRSFKENGIMRWREFGTTKPRSSVLGKGIDIVMMAAGSMGLTQGVTDNASVNVLPQGDGRVWALTETVTGTFEVSVESLKTLGQVHYADSLSGQLTTAHPRVLPNGDVINILSTPGEGFTIYRQPNRTFVTGNSAAAAAPRPTRERIATIPHRKPWSPAWIHDFPCSNNYAIIPETPLYFNLPALMLGRKTEHIFLDWIPDDGALLHVASLKDGTVRSFHIPVPFFAFHWANAFESEDGRYVHIDGAVYSDPEIVNHLFLENVRAGWKASQGGETGEIPRSQFLRLTLDMQAPPCDYSSSRANIVTQTQSGWTSLVPDTASYGDYAEFPHVSPSKKGMSYRYAWTTAAVRPTNLNNALAKMDLESGTCEMWHEGGGIVGEPAFVPRPGASDEDDGVVMSIITEAGDGTAALLILDGKSHKEVARARLPYSLTNGFHGAFIPRS